MNAIRNTAAINRVLAIHGEAIGNGSLVDHECPAYYDGNQLHILQEAFGFRSLLSDEFGHEQSHSGRIDDVDVEAVNRSLEAVCGETGDLDEGDRESDEFFTVVDLGDFGDELDAINRALEAVHGETVDFVDEDEDAAVNRSLAMYGEEI